MNALTRWGLGTVVAGVALAVLLAPKGEDRLISARYASSRADSLFRAWATERQKYGVVRQVVERGQARADARPFASARGESPIFRFDAAIGVEARGQIEALVRSELSGSRSLPPRYPIVVAAILDTTLLGLTYTQAIVLPERAGEPCTVVLRLPRLQRARFGRAATQRLLGTCAFYAAFGAPGAGTERWLVDSRGTSARFLVRPSALLDDTLQFEIGVARTGWNAVSESLLRCRMGTAEACLNFVGPESTEPGYFDFNYDTPIDRRALTTEFPGVSVVQSGNWQAEPGRLRSETLAALAARMGPERFGAVWRDPRGLQDAYQANTGQSFAGFVHEHVSARTRQYVAGPATTALQTVFAVAIVVLLALASVRWSPRRMA